jgi:hypothetical protein
MEFKIQDSSLSKLEKIMTGGGSSSSGISSDEQRKSNIAQLGKLGAVAIGITSLVTLVGKITSMLVDSSPMLQSMLKLFKVGILFILRPIGDFIGFLLRPLMIYMLRNIFLPWYRNMAPIMRAWGGTLGADLLNFFKDPFGTIQDWIENTWWGKIMAFFLPVIGILYVIEKVRDILADLDIDLGEIAGAIGEKVTAFFSSLGEKLQELWDGAVSAITAFGEWISNSFGKVGEWLGTAWSNFIVWITGNIGIISNWIGTAWDNFISFFTNGIGLVWEILGTAWNAFVSFWTAIGGGIGYLVTIWEDFVEWITSLGDMLDIFDPSNLFGGLGESVSNGISNMFGGNSTNNNSLTINSGGGGNSIDEIKDEIMSWWEDVVSRHGN